LRSQVLDGGTAAFVCVALQGNLLRLAADADSRSLTAVRGVFQPGVADRDVVGLALDVDSDPRLLAAVVADRAALDPIAVAAAELADLRPEEDAPGRLR